MVSTSSSFSRSLFSIIANILKGILTLVSAIIIARGLGANDYGIYAFLLASFIAIKSLLDMGTSNAFYTFISKSAHSKAFYLYYITWVFFQFILSVMIIFLLLPDNWIERI